MNRILGTLLVSVLLGACAAPTGLAVDPAPPAGTAAWTLLGDAPGPRSGQTSIYDAAQDRMLVFGGGANDLWAQRFSGPNAGGWERIEAGGDVPPPIPMTAVIDAGTNRLLVFPSDSLERAWSLPLDGRGAWSLAGFGAAPKIALGFSLAADPGGRRLFAYTSGTPEVWTLPLDGDGTWQRLAGPPDHGGFSCRDDLVFDGKHARLLVLAGGWPRGNVYTLSLDAALTWTKLNQDMAWFEYGAATAYDEKAARFLVADAANSGWIWSFGVGDATPKWSHMKVAGAPPGTRWGGSGVYDSTRDRLVLFGGTDEAQAVHDDTWALSLGDAPAWSQVGTLDAVTSSGQGTTLAVADQGSIVRFGGWSFGGAVLFDAGTASWRALGDPPSAPRAWTAGAWDPSGQRLVTFGGYDNVEQNQTWALDVHGPAWTEIDGSGARPDARSHHAMVRDASGGRMLVFGGQRSGSGSPTYFGDLWALSVPGDVWTKLDVPGPQPSARASFAAALDETGRRMFVHGGESEGGQLDDTWVLDLDPSPRWTKIAKSSGAPPALSGHFAAFDPAMRRFVVVGNLPAASTSSFDGVSVWALSTDGAPRWQRYCPKGTRPATVDGAGWTDGGLFVTSGGSAWRFDPSTPTCD